MRRDDQPWDNRSQSPFLSDEEDRKVMDLSNYHHPSPMMMCYGRGSPGQESVLRLQQEHGSHYQPQSPCSSRSSDSPQPSRSVITSVASLNLHQASSSSPSSPGGRDQRYTPAGSPGYYLQESSIGRHVSLSTAASIVTSTRKKKQPQPIPDECKDNAYWERRKRNNESAKRSRELRRNKERHTSERVHHLETENLQLRTEVSMLRNEVEKLRQLLIPKSSVMN